MKLALFLATVSLAAPPQWYPTWLPSPNAFGNSPWVKDDFIHDLFYGYETPITLHITSSIGRIKWGSVAVMSEDYEHPWPGYPMIRAVPKFQTDWHMAGTMYYGLSHWIEHGQKPAYAENQMNFKNYGLAKNRWSTEQFQKLQRCFDLKGKLVKMCIEAMKPYDKGTESIHLEMCAYHGAVVAAIQLDVAKKDGWNSLGDKEADGMACTADCHKNLYRDTTGYHSKNKGGVNMTDPYKWQPEIETNGRGFFYATEHVTPQLAKVDFIAAKAMGVSNPPLEDPQYDYPKEMELVYQRAKELIRSPERQAAVKLWDNKLVVASTVSLEMSKMVPVGERDIVATSGWAVGYNVAEHDAIVAAWKEKVRFDKVRPTSWSKYMTKEKEVEWYNGEMVSSKHWKPLVRLMPHSEFPSASAAICRVIADYNKLMLKEFWDLDELETTWTAKKGELGRGMPTKDVSFTLKNLDELAEICGKSRLDGGMHFTASVEAGAKSVKGFGQAAFDWVNQMHKNREWTPYKRDCGLNVAIKFNKGSIKTEKYKVAADADPCECQDRCEEWNPKSLWTLKTKGKSGKCTCIVGSFKTATASRTTIAGPVNSIRVLMGQPLNLKEQNWGGY